METRLREEVEQTKREIAGLATTLVGHVRNGGSVRQIVDCGDALHQVVQKLAVAEAELCRSKKPAPAQPAVQFEHRGSDLVEAGYGHGV